MTPSESSFRFRRSALAVAACLVCAPFFAMAEGDEPKPIQATITLGAGAINGDSADKAQFGQYNGLRDRKAAATLDIDYNLRDESKSTWVQFDGSNLLGDSRDMSLVWKNPGSWKFKFNYGELVRTDPNAANSGLLNAGSIAPGFVVLPGGPGSGAETDFKTKRTGLGFGFTKIITPALQFELDLKSERKEGSRLFGIGANCPTAAVPGCLGTTGVNTGWAQLLSPEPINSNHSQMEARVNFGAEKFRVNLGYYGSFYRNANNTLTPSIPGSLNNPLGNLLPLNTGVQGLLGQPVALAPDNQAHQFDLSGSYDFTNTTRGTFKLGRSTATQTQAFSDSGFVGPAGASSLDARVDTRLVRLGLTSRPMPKLSLVADLRYERKDDLTPLVPYNNDGTTSSTNTRLPSLKQGGKLQASWQFNSDYRGTVGADFESLDRDTFTSSSSVNGISALRQKTSENGVRAELRRRMAENFSGTVGFVSSTRTGSNWLKPNAGTGVTEVANPTDPATGFTSTSVFMPTLADRKRDKIRFVAEWQPVEALNLQFNAEEGKDRYTMPTSYGLQDNHMSQYGVDWAYAVSDKWSVNGYVSRAVQTLNQIRPAGYVMAFDNTSVNLGLGVVGKATSSLEVGANLSYMDDTSAYAQTLDVLAGADSAALLAATGGLPNITYRKAALRLYGKYKVDKSSSVRLDLVQQRWTVNDWTWNYNGVPFTYSDGTTVVQKPTQTVGFVGVSYVYQWQ